MHSLTSKLMALCTLPFFFPVPLAIFLVNLANKSIVIATFQTHTLILKSTTRVTPGPTQEPTSMVASNNSTSLKKLTAA